MSKRQLARWVAFTCVCVGRWGVEEMGSTARAKRGHMRGDRMCANTCVSVYVCVCQYVRTFVRGARSCLRVPGRVPRLDRPCFFVCMCERVCVCVRVCVHFIISCLGFFLTENVRIHKMYSIKRHAPSNIIYKAHKQRCIARASCSLRSSRVKPPPASSCQ